MMGLRRLLPVRSQMTDDGLQIKAGQETMLASSFGHLSSVIRHLWTVSILCVVPLSSFAGEILGGHEGWLDRMGAGVRELGRGNTGTALEGASPAAFWNPALLPFIRKTEVSVGADIRSQDRNGGFVSLQGRVASNLGLGAGLVNRGDYNVQAYDENENDIGYARPQAYATYFGMGMRTSRRNALGVSLLVYSSSLELQDGVGEVDFVGGINLGWYRRYDSLNAANLVPASWTGIRRVADFFSGSFSSAVVVRNLGLNPRLAAEFEQSVAGEDGPFGFGSTAGDFFPKTLVVAGEWRKNVWNRPFTLSGEVMDYQLKKDFFTADPASHKQAARVGLECEVAERTYLRAGMDRLNPTIGLGYGYRMSRRQVIQFDYALTMERGIMTFNPYAFGIKTAF
jgi:hypothetical protein